MQADHKSVWPLDTQDGPNLGVRGRICSAIGGWHPCMAARNAANNADPRQPEQHLALRDGTYFALNAVKNKGSFKINVALSMDYSRSAVMADYDDKEAMQKFFKGHPYIKDIALPDPSVDAPAQVFIRAWVSFRTASWWTETEVHGRKSRTRNWIQFFDIRSTGAISEQNMQY
jgi:hypothetical protein